MQRDCVSKDFLRWKYCYFYCSSVGFMLLS